MTTTPVTPNSRPTAQPGATRSDTGLFGRMMTAAISTAATVTLLAACGGLGATPQADDAGTGQTGTSTEQAAVATETTASEAMADNHDYWLPEATESQTVTITLSGDRATVQEDSGQDDAVQIEDNTVTILAAGTYLLTGDLDGQVVVDAGAEDQVQLILDGVSITNSTGPAIQVNNADGVEIVLADGTENTVSDAGTGEDLAKAAIHSRADLVISGQGALHVTGESADGIASTKDLVLTGGVIEVNAGDDGIRGEDALVITGGQITVTSGGDALKSNNDADADRGYVLITGGELDLTAGTDAIDAETDLLISGGTIEAITGGGAGTALAEDASAKGLKSGVLTIVEDASITVDAADDAVHSDGSVVIGGGTLELATGDDGVHADATLLITGGSLTVTESEEGLEAQALSITGGDVTITARDDGLNASSGESGTGQGGRPMESDDGSTLLISGGTVVIDAEGDGIDSNGALDITGGTVIVYGTSSGGNGAFDSNGQFTISGGSVLALSAGQMEQTPSGEQDWITAVGTGQAGTQVAIVAADSTVAEVTAVKSFGWVFYSAPELGDAEHTVTLDDQQVQAGSGQGTQAAPGDQPGPGTPAGPGSGGREDRRRGQAPGDGTSGPGNGTPPRPGELHPGGEDDS